MSDQGQWGDVERLYGQYAPMVRLAHLLTGSLDTAEDVVHDAMLRVAGKLDQISNPEGYLRIAVINGCRSQHRRDLRATRLVDSSVEPMYSQPARELLDQLVRLPDRQRIAVVLRFYLDFSDDDIAEQLGCSVATVRVLVFRALRRLREVIRL